MQKVFMPSCISCLDKYMSVWMNKFTCPGFFFCPCKPHPKGKEYHTICCGKSGMIYGWDIFEGMNHKTPMGRPEFETSPNMNTVGIILRLTIALYITGNAVIMYSSYCVLKGISETRKRVVYGRELIKIGNFGLRGSMEMELTIT